MQPRTHAAFLAGTVWAMSLLTAAFIAALVSHNAWWGPDWFDSVVNFWMGELTLWAPMVVY